MLLERAMARFGRERLCKEMNVPLHLLDAWLNGHASMPDRKLLDLAEVLDKHSDEPSGPE